MSPWAAHLLSHLLYGLAWASFGFGHSALAALSVHDRLKPLLGPWYRLAYNAFATLHLVAVWAVGMAVLGWSARHPFAFLSGWALVAMTAVAVAGVLLMIWFLRWYDTGRLMGTRQLRAARHGGAESDEEPFHIEGPHRYMRHPLYAAGFLIFWGLASSEMGLATAVWGSLYMIVGSRHEERKLLALTQGAYGDYRARVPAFLPWRGRAWGGGPVA